MRLKLGLAALFALVAILPLALAVQWHRDASAAILRDAHAERADRIAMLLGAVIDRELADLEASGDRICEEGAEHPGSHVRALSPAAVHPNFESWRPSGRHLRIERDFACGAHPVRLELEPLALLPEVRAGDVQISVIEGDDAREARGERRVVRTFDARAGARSLSIVVQVAPAPLAVREREQTALRLEVVAIAALVIALLLGWIVGSRITHSLSEIERAAQRIGQGDLEVRLDRGRGGAGATFSAFNQMAQELREAQARAKRAERVAAWRDIARRIAHEIKNPLTPIRMSIETMRRTKKRQHPDFDEIFEESTRTVLEETERMERIVTEFSRFARLPRPKPRLLDVREVVAQVVALHSPGGDATITDTSPRMPIKMVLADHVPEVRADRDQLVQVLVNLIQNAIDAAQSKHGEHGGHVEVEVGTRPDGQVSVTVMDDGPGIPEEERARVLEPYYTTKARGTGLGLSIVDRIVGEHGGTLEIGESRRGGAAITFTLTREGPAEEPDASQTG